MAAAPGCRGREGGAMTTVLVCEIWTPAGLVPLCCWEGAGGPNVHPPSSTGIGGGGNAGGPNMTPKKLQVSLTGSQTVAGAQNKELCSF